MTSNKYILPYAEYKRLRNKAYRAQQQNHFEICGLMMLNKDSNTIHLHFVPNANSVPGHYEIRIENIDKLEGALLNTGKAILGTFHSHPIGEPLPTKGDLINGFYNDTELIYDVCSREFKLWRIIDRDEMKIEELQLIKGRRQKRSRRRKTKVESNHPVSGPHN